MTPEAFRDLCDRLGLSYAAVARLLDLNERTPRRWASGEIPIPKMAALVLALLDQKKVTENEIGKILKPYS